MHDCNNIQSFATNIINNVTLTNTAHKEALEKLVKEHESLINKVCRIYAFNSADRQDLYQEIMIQLWRSFPGFNNQSKFGTWLYKVAIYTAISGLRKQRDFIRTTEPENLPDHRRDEGYDPVKEEQLEGLYLAIGQLNEIEKAIVMLYLENKQYDEMEEILGINQGNLRVKMTRIKDKLKKLIKQ